MEGPDLSADVEAFRVPAYSVKRLAAAGHRSNSQLGMGRLQTLAERKLVLRKTSGADRRQSFLSLTAPGHKAMGKLESGTNAEIAALLRDMSAPRQSELTGAMRSIEAILGGHSECRENCQLRQHRPGDLGWIVSAHGRMYAEEYGWDGTFEAFVARIAADFIDNYDPVRERCWIAERGAAEGGVGNAGQAPGSAGYRQTPFAACHGGR